MPLPKDVYLNCDILENIPNPNRDNWLYEIELLRQELPLKASILQVGSMDGTRIIRLLKARQDLRLTGMEIEGSLIKIAKQKVASAGLSASFVQGDITKPQNLQCFDSFDYVICLNNTLGYIPDQEKAIEGMKKLGKIVVISVYGEKFHDDLAKAYFKSIGLEIDRIENNSFVMKDFTIIKRYTKEEAISWGGKVIETPIGYFCVLDKYE